MSDHRWQMNNTTPDGADSCPALSPTPEGRRHGNPSNGHLKKVLITGAGTGFGYEVAMRLAEKGFDVVAAVEIYGQVQTLNDKPTSVG